MRAYLVAAGLLLFLLGGTAFYIQQRFAAVASGNYAAPPATIAAGTAESRLWRETIDAVGTIRAAQGILLTAETTGDITAMHAGSGDNVELGAPLIGIDEEFEVATRKRLEARLLLADQLYQRDARLIKENSIPQSQLDQSRADLQSAEAELAEIDAILKNKRISAPFQGRLGIFQVRLGDYVEAGTPLVTLQDVSQLEVDFSVPDRYAPLMQPGLRITLRTAAFPERLFSATLQAVDSQIDENTRNLQIRATISDGEGLLPGMFASLIIDLNQETERVFVPETAVSYSLQGNLVYVIEEDDDGLFVSPRVVKTLAANNGDVAIVSGIADGERIVIAGQNKLYRGARVEIDPNAGI
ncbi:efflux RND transporter periplasmic adaptor subunit [Congregibacter sp.]|uniref:efflux RND transporter periplasmic adaptor subunit n=1 Tax=Congregibacter sp. TaxID=2744308 RepID=UPI003F6BA7BA